MFGSSHIAASDAFKERPTQTLSVALVRGTWYPESPICGVIKEYTLKYIGIPNRI